MRRHTMRHRHQHGATQMTRPTMTAAIRHARIEIDRGNGWQIRQEGE